MAKGGNFTIYIYTTHATPYGTRKLYVIPSRTGSEFGCAAQERVDRVSISCPFYCFKPKVTINNDLCSFTNSLFEEYF